MTFRQRLANKIKRTLKNEIPDVRNWDNCDMNTNGEAFFVRAYAGSWRTCFDIGANRGDYARLLLGTNPRLEVVCFEPLIQAASPLRDTRIKLHVCSVGDYDGTAAINQNEHDSTQSSVFRSGVDTHAVQVPQVTLDTFGRDNGIEYIDFCKIDTEGSEVAVVTGAQDLIRANRIGMIQFEYGGTYLDAGTTLQNMYALLSPYYIICHMLPLGLLPLAYSSDLETYRYSNWVAISRRKFGL